MRKANSVLCFTLFLKIRKGKKKPRWIYRSTFLVTEGLPNDLGMFIRGMCPPSFSRKLMTMKEKGKKLCQIKYSTLVTGKKKPKVLI